MNAVPDIKSLAQKISGLTKNGLDDASTTGKNRRELQIAMRELGFALESTSETMQRLAYLVSLVELFAASDTLMGSSG